jgi:hypothetical protein
MGRFARHDQGAGLVTFSDWDKGLSNLDGTPLGKIFSEEHRSV